MIKFNIDGSYFCFKTHYYSSIFTQVIKPLYITWNTFFKKITLQPHKFSRYKIKDILLLSTKSNGNYSSFKYKMYSPFPRPIFLHHFSPIIWKPSSEQSGTEIITKMSIDNSIDKFSLNHDFYF